MNNDSIFSRTSGFIRQILVMSTFDRRNALVKCVTPVKFIKGLDPRIAGPVLIFSIFIVALFLWFLGKTPSKNNWVILRDYEGLRPHHVPQPVDNSYLESFAFVRPIESALTPKSVRFDSPLGSEHGAMTYNAQSFMVLNSRLGSNHLADDLNGIGGMNTDLGDPVYSVSAGRVIYAADAGEGWGNMVIIEHAIGDGKDRRYVQSLYAHLKVIYVLAGVIVRRGEVVGEVGGANGKYPAHLHFEMRDSNVADPNKGYSKKPLNRLNPTETLREWRGADKDLLNVSPKIQGADAFYQDLEFEF